MRSTSYTGTRTLLPGVRYSTDTETDASGTNYWPNTEVGDLKIYWERGPAKVGGGGYDLPRFTVNPSPWPDSKTFMRGAAYPVIPPGALSCHPGAVNSENYCAVLRFTVPRDGTYAVTAKAWNQNTGKTAVSLLVNGTVRSARRAWTSPGSAVTTNDFSLAAASYTTGETVAQERDPPGSAATEQPSTRRKHHA